MVRPRTRQLLGLSAMAAAIVACSEPMQAYPEELAGVGLVLQSESSGQTVKEVIANGPAATAGVSVGDQVLAIDGEATSGKTLAEVVHSLRGRAGTTVSIRLRGPRGETTTALTRRVLTRKGTNYTTN
jgi:carboxyl-terminal processing protease